MSSGGQSFLISDCSRYVYRLVRNFIEDSKRCGVLLVLPSGLIADMPRRQGIFSLVEALRDDTERTKLVQQCNSNSLLMLRCQQLGTNLSSGEKILRLIENHYKVVGWHLQRLYRLRNSIVHSASTENSNLLPYVRISWRDLFSVRRQLFSDYRNSQ